MVRLTRIYTKGGDKGTTSLGTGKRVPKHDQRVEAYGTVDEANAAIGIVRLHTNGDEDAMLAGRPCQAIGVGAGDRSGQLAGGWVGPAEVQALG